MVIIKKRYSLSKKIKLIVKNNIFYPITQNQVDRIDKLISLEQSRGYSVSLSSYDWRICLIEKQIHPKLNITLLLPDLVIEPEYSIPKNSFYTKYKHEYFSKHGLYGDDCDWFFSFNPRRYNLDLKAVKNAAIVEKIKITKSCKKTPTRATFLSETSFINYIDYSYRSRNIHSATWNYKFKSHLVSMADYFQLEYVVNMVRAKAVFRSISEAASEAEKVPNLTHGQSIEYFYHKLQEIDPLPDIDSFKTLWKNPVFMNKLSGIYFAKGDIENYINCKKIELNELLKIHSNKPKNITESVLLSSLHSHITKGTSVFRNRNINDRKFENLIFGKSVAIVGSASTAQPQGAEIDNFDIVSRMNFPVDNSENVLYLGKRTDVIYKSTSIIRNVDNNQSSQNSGIFYNYLSIIPLLNNENNARTIQELGNNLLTMPHSAPRSLIDLITFSPRKIKVFNCTLYANINKASTYDEKYREKISNLNIKNLSFTQQGKLISNFSHDFCLNFLLMKCMYLENLYEADDKLKEVLEMSLENYINNLVEG